MTRGIKLLLLAAIIALSACQPPPVSFNSTDITGASFAKGFTLTDHTGSKRELADFSGKLLVIFFGFTQCPDVCPNTMVKMKAVVDSLGDQADQVQVAFVTVDPERDSQEVLAQYVPAFDQRFIGLRADLEQTKVVANEFKVFFSKVPGRTEGTYSVDHTAATYVFDRNGKVRLMVRHGAEISAIASDLKQLLNS